ncbi:MAG: YIP1 family protein [Fidelibacterota bacterium]
MNNLLNVIIEPRNVFTSLIQRSHWQDAYLPLLVTAIVGLGSMFVLKDLLVEVQLAQTEKYIMNNSSIPDDQKEEFLNDSLEKIQNPSKMMTMVGYVSSVLSTPIRILFMSLIVLMTGNFFFGGKSSFGNILVMTSYTYMVAVIESFVKIPLMITQWRTDVQTGLGLLGIGEQGDFIYHFLSGMDLFALWRISLLAVGMSVLYRREFKPFLIALVIYWILQTTFFSLLGSMFA